MWESKIINHRSYIIKYHLMQQNQTFGLKPYSIPKNNDTMFEIIFHDNIKFWAKHTGKSKRVSKELLNIFSHIFCDENDRYTINKLIKHKYVR
mmetsp:Transcript_3031/g.3690  ORF Transcript_3031/g.3690 Transcript_3031/m.3690 type:complete len:93 (-) Transcript_3031:35-313(-)